MSRDLLNALLEDEPYLQTPVDDLWSFYYVGQWAATYNTMSLDTKKLLRLREDLTGNLKDRGDATTTVTDPRGLQASDYGTFLANSHSVLVAWHSRLNDLSLAWYKDTVNLQPAPEDRYNAYYPLFKDYTQRGVLEYLRLLVKEFGSLQ
jgi:hypothetical protein